MRSLVLAKIPGFRQRIIPEPHVPSRGYEIDYNSSNNIHEKISQFWLAKSNAMFSKYNVKKRNTGQRKKYSANKINFLTF
jgi:hypothetical protein